jgi:dUTP pyrophosphatase
MKSTNIKFHKLNRNAVLPRHGSNDAAGYDLYACIDAPITIKPHTTQFIGTGLSFELPQGTFVGIYARSGLAAKFGIRPANCVGICDSDYRGEYVVACHNDSDKDVVINPGDRIAQMVLQEYIEMNFVEDTLTETERGAGGFGSTGK